MLSISNIDVVETYREFKRRGIKVTFLVPTETALAKSIMDATKEVRDYLSQTNAHDYATQPQGPDHKATLDTTVVSRGDAHSTTTSLYRPITKEGDPRIWIYRLNDYANAGDLLALAYAEGRLVVINCSTTDLATYLERPNSEVSSLRKRAHGSSAFDDLLAELRSIATRGYIKTLRRGDTGVGFTLETLLGIAANSSKKPDYRGIELKATRMRTAQSGQATVFSQVPDWKASRLGGSKHVLDERGQYNARKGRVQLYHEISAKAPNSYNMQLDVDDNLLRQMYVPNDGERIEDVRWDMAVLKARVAEKHRESAWITAETRGRGVEEEFRYIHLKHANGVDPDALPILLESGAMTVHYLIKATPTGGAKDQGYLFKTSPKNIELLFASVTEYNLLS